MHIRERFIDLANAVAGHADGKTGLLVANHGSQSPEEHLIELSRSAMFIYAFLKVGQLGVHVRSSRGSTFYDNVAKGCYSYLVKTASCYQNGSLGLDDLSGIRSIYHNLSSEACPIHPTAHICYAYSE